MIISLFWCIIHRRRKMFCKTKTSTADNDSWDEMMTVVEYKLTMRQTLYRSDKLTLQVLPLPKQLCSRRHSSPLDIHARCQKLILNFPITAFYIQYAWPANWPKIIRTSFEFHCVSCFSSVVSKYFSQSEISFARAALINCIMMEKIDSKLIKDRLKVWNIEDIFYRVLLLLVSKHLMISPQLASLRFFQYIVL